ncbi:MAG: transglutaminase domain-containing protein [Phycisphaerales bacterium]|nr:transglutaminase domain-containing protein [Phycisphaerales bacterium]
MKLTPPIQRRIPLIFLCGAAMLAASIATAAAAPKTAGPMEPPENQESWYVVTIRGQQCGYVHEILRRVGDEVLSESDTQISIMRGDATVKMKMERAYRETIDGRPLAFRAVQTLGSMPQTIEGEIRGDKILLTTTQPGAKFENEYDFDPECRFSWGQTIASKRHGLAPGTEYEIKTYDPSIKMDGPIEMRIHIHGEEKVDVLGKPEKLHRMTSSMKIEASNMTVDSEVWVNDELTPVITNVDVGPIQMRMYRTTKEEALKNGAPPEMFLETIITSNRDVSREAKEVKYRLSMKPDAKGELPDMPDTDMQKFERIDKRSAFITVCRSDWSALRNAPADAKETPDSIKPYLQASSVCDSGNSKIKRLAIRACKKDDSLATKADKLRKYITKYIVNKGMDVGFGTATEVVETQAGDCTEHGVLLAAIARAAGLPARGVGGLVGVPGSFRRNADGPMDFGFHMWTQVYIHGKWIDIDAAMRQTDCDTTHIAISLIPLGDGDLMGEIWSIVPMLGQLDIEVVDVKE